MNDVDVLRGDDGDHGNDDEYLDPDCGSVHEVLHAGVRDVFAPGDFAARIEAAAKRRRTTRWSALSAIAVVALGTTIGTVAAVHAGGGGGAGAAASYTAITGWRPLCADNIAKYTYASPKNPPDISIDDATSAMPPGAAAATVCRYAGSGEKQAEGTLAGSLTVTDPARLDQLRSALNASIRSPLAPTTQCSYVNDQIAIVLIAYPHTSAVRQVRYDRFCWLLIDRSVVRTGTGSFDQLVTNWTGNWQPTAIASVR